MITITWANGCKHSLYSGSAGSTGVQRGPQEPPRYTGARRGHLGTAGPSRGTELWRHDVNGVTDTPHQLFPQRHLIAKSHQLL